MAGILARFGVVGPEQVTVGPVVAFWPKGVWTLVWVDYVASAHRQCLARGIEVTRPPTDEPWGVRELHICHPGAHVFRLSKGLGGAE